MSRLDKREWLLPILILLVGTSLQFGDVIFAGRTLSTSAFEPSTMGGEPPYGYPEEAPPVNLYLRDPLVSAIGSEPEAERAHRELFSFDIPLWDPVKSLGQPLLAKLQPQLVNLLRLVVAIEPSPWVWDVFLLVRLLVAGLAVFAVCRRWGLGPGAGTVGAAIYAFSGYMHLHINTTHVDFATLLPISVLVVEKVIQKQTASRVVMMALVMTVGFLVDNPQSGLVLVGASAAYGSFRVIHRRRERGVEARRPSLSLFLAYVLAGGLLSFALLPFLELTGIGPFDGFGVHGHGADASKGLASLPLWESTRLLFPYAFGAPFERPALNVEFDTYFGLAAVFLALLGLRHRTFMRRIGWFWAAAGVVVTLKMFGVYPFQWVGNLPILSSLNFMLYGAPVANLSLAVMGAAGYVVLRENRSSLTPSGRSPAITAGITVVVLALALLWAGYLLRPENAAFTPRSAVLATILTAVGAASLHLATGSRSRRGSVLAITLLIVIGEPFLLSLPSQGHISPAGSRFLDAALPIVERPVRHDPFQVPPFAEDLIDPDDGTGRVVAVDGVLFPNTGSSGLGIPDLRGHSATVSDRYLRLIHAFVDPDAGRPFTGRSWNPWYQTEEGQERFRDVLDLTGIRHVLSRRALPTEDGSPKGRDLRLIREGPIKVYRNETAFPKAFATYDFVAASSPQDAIRRMRSVPDWSEVAVVEVPHGGLPEPAGTHQERTSGSPGLRLIHYEDEYIEMEVTMRDDGFVVLGDSFYPGWWAEVDDRPATVLPAYAALRAVRVASGTHTIRMGFSPMTWRIGSGITTAAMLLCAAALAGTAGRGWWTSRRRSTAHQRRATRTLHMAQGSSDS